MSIELNGEEREEILRFLNEVAPDTYNEGEAGNHTFKDVMRAGAAWTVELENDDGEETITFSFDGPVLDGGILSTSWLEAFNAAYYEGDSGDGAFE